MANKKLSIQDIATELGVSKSTVSRAISGKGRMSEKTRQRILEYIEENNYRPNSIAKSFAERKTHNIAVVLPEDDEVFEMPFFQVCLLGISRALTAYNYDVVVVTTKQDDISNLKRVVENHKVDGIILTRLMENDMQIEFLKKNRVRFVAVGTYEKEQISHVDSNNRAASEDLTLELMKRVPKRVAYLGSDSRNLVNNERYKGFREGIHKSGIVLEKLDVYFGMNKKEDIDSALEKLLKEDVDLIICEDDYLCSRVLNYIDFHDMRIPEDVSVASLYNSRVLENHFPPITSVKFNIMELGMQAGHLILEVVENNILKSVEISSYEILLRESTRNSSPN